jgi:hypothetical protein
MATLPFALSIHKFINSVGADVGFASIIAVAILILLYFAHARETATLRDRLDEAHARIGGLEARIGQLMHAQAAAQRGRVAGPVTPAPVAPAPVRPMGSAIASVRRIPTPVTAAAGGAGATAVVSAPSGPGAGTPSAPVGMAAPALASATKLIPDPVAPPTPAGAPDDTVFVPAATAAGATAAGATNGKSSETAPLTAATQAIPAVAAASARTPSASPRGVAPPPRVQIGAETAIASGGGRRTAQSPRQTPLIPPAHEGRRRPLAGRMLPLAIGGIAVAVIVVGLIVITNTGGSTSGNVSHNNTSANQTGASLVNKHHASAPFKASKFRVAVLNGTAVSNLAADVGTKLAGTGFRKGNATNAASQTQAATVVYYVRGSGEKANRIAAQHVAKALSLAPTRVHPATQASIQSCAISAAGTPLKSCSADVIVSVGADRASLASSSSSG